ncbi:MAG: nucleotide exchange factor GrpE [Parachlamydiales bacterium]|nr:nucleotide exchange factor GrpE [Parachlamydiales bacterium]
MSEEKKDKKQKEETKVKIEEVEKEDTNAKFFELENKYLRLLAEMENSRKRMQKEKSEALVFAMENVIVEFLPIIDNFENALAFADKTEGEVKNWAIGFQMILSQLKDVLHNHNIVAFHSVGNMFDPHCHEAMEIVETNDYPDGSIIEELAKGYKSSNRTIRPARVKVAKSLIEDSIDKTNESSENIDKEDEIENDETIDTATNFEKN